MLGGLSSKDILGGLKTEQKEIAKLATAGLASEAFTPTVMLGLLTEVDCFKAIKEMGDVKFYLKDLLVKKMSEFPRDEKEIARITAGIKQVHANQLVIVNDVCVRFEVIHPEIKYPTKEMLEKKNKYWDWYKAQHKKVYGEVPEIPSQFVGNDTVPNPENLEGDAVKGVKVQ